MTEDCIAMARAALDDAWLALTHASDPSYAKKLSRRAHLGRALDLEGLGAGAEPGLTWDEQG